MRYGYRIDLTGSPVIDSIPNRKTRNTIRRAGEEIEYCRQGTLAELEALHWNPTYLPAYQNSMQTVWVAILDDTIPPISAVLIEKHGDHLVYRYAGNDKRYRKYNGNTYLLWYIAESYNGKGFKYIDLGGSKQPGIEAFKRRMSTSSYILKEKPLAHRILAKVEYHIRELVQ